MTTAKHSLTADEIRLLPTPGEAMYVPPSRDGLPKSCATCSLWSTDARCAVLPAKLRVPADAVCSYWVEGIDEYHPPHRIRLPMLRPLDPKLAGLMRVPSRLDGTACGSCRWFSPARARDATGACLRVRAFGAKPRLATVHRLGCCARWQAGRT
jgi:hypothetical protein